MGVVDGVHEGAQDGDARDGGMGVGDVNKVVDEGRVLLRVYLHAVVGNVAARWRTNSRTVTSQM